MTTANLSITGMSCGGCVSRVTRALEAVPGVAVKSVQVGSAVLDVPDPATLTAAAEAVARAGFQARVVSPAPDQSPRATA